MSELKEIVARALIRSRHGVREPSPDLLDAFLDEAGSLVKDLDKSGFVIVPKQRGDTGAMIGGGIRRDTSMAPLNAQWLNLKEPKG